MPLYEYECEACGRRFEVIRRFSDLPLDVCTQCGSGPVRRLPSSPAIQFKGSGFYITDYGKKKGESEGRADERATDQKEDAKSDAAAADKVTKAETKTETAAKTDAPAKSNLPAKPSGSSPTTSGGTKD